MGLFDNFPYTNFHELNLDWILKVLKDIETTIDQFVSLNIIKYADPIQWDITRQYPKNIIVIDPISGTAYISVDNVPQGVALSNTDYWSVVFDLGRFITLAASNFADSYESVLTTTATMPTDEGKWVVWNSILYEALNDIHVGDRYVEDGNIKRRTVEYFCDKIKDQIAAEIQARINADNLLRTDIDAEVLARGNADITLQNNIDAEVLARGNADITLQNNIDGEVMARQTADGNLNDLTTTAKNSLVDAINEVNSTGGGAVSTIGDMTSLHTSNKSTVVGAINESYDQNNYQDVVGVKEFGCVCDGATDDSDALQDAVNASYDKVLVINGDMFISKPIRIRNSITIRGNNATIHVAQNFPATGGLVGTSEIFGINAQHVHIDGINFDGVANTNLDSAIIINASQYVTISNCTFTDIRGCAVWIRDNNYYITVDNCHAFHCDYVARQNSGGAFESALGGNSIVNHYITFSNSSAKSCGNAGFQMYDTDNGLIVNCAVDDMIGLGDWEDGNGIMVEHRTTVSNCTVTNIANAGYFITGNNNIIEGCRAYKCGGMAVDMWTGGVQAYGNTIDGCSFESCALEGHPDQYETSGILCGTNQHRLNISNVNITAGGNELTPVNIIGFDGLIDCNFENIHATDVSNINAGISIRGTQRLNTFFNCDVQDERIYVQNYNATTKFVASRSYDFIDINASSGNTWTNTTGLNLLIQVGGTISSASVNSVSAGTGGLYFVKHNGTLNVTGTSLTFKATPI